MVFFIQKKIIMNEAKFLMNYAKKYYYHYENN